MSEAQENATVREIYPHVRAALTDEEYAELCGDLQNAFVGWNAAVEISGPESLINAIAAFVESRSKEEFGQLMADVLNALKSYGVRASEEADDLFEDIKVYD